MNLNLADLTLWQSRPDLLMRDMALDIAGKVANRTGTTHALTWV